MAAVSSYRKVLLSQVTNETLILNCYWQLRLSRTLRRPLAISQRKARATVGQYALNPPGYTRATKARTMGSDTER